MATLDRCFQERDSICIRLGSGVPVVPRQRDGAGEWERIEAGYFYHVMTEEVYQLIREGAVDLRSFILG